MRLSSYNNLIYNLIYSYTMLYIVIAPNEPYFTKFSQGEVRGTLGQCHLRLAPMDRFEASRPTLSPAFHAAKGDRVWLG